jgi:hypothetical protein
MLEVYQRTAPGLTRSRPRTRAATRHDRRPGLVLLATALAALAAAGSWQVARLARPDAPPGVSTGGVSVSVVSSEQVAGLTDDDLSGMSHGIQGLVTADKAMVKVNVLLAGGRHGGGYDLRALRLRAGGQLLEPVGASLVAGRLNPGARIEGSIAFVVPRSGTDLALLATDTGDSVSLGTVDLAPPGSDPHSHGTSGSAGSDVTVAPAGPALPSAAATGGAG